MSNQQPMDGKSHDLKAEKLEALKQQFPELFSEGKLDVEKLKQSLDENYVAGDERYRLEWAGKHRVFEEIAKRTTGTLTPDLERSVDFENSQNVFIEGENLEVLRILQKSYFNKVKMIYIDPPYNTGNDFVYNDNFRETAEEYAEAAGNVDEQGNLAKAFTLNSKDSGQYHSNWLNMMYPRLYLARNLLREDGVIFVSIDDNEVHNLRMVMNEVFGEENFLNSFIVRRRVKSLNLQFADEGLRSLNVGFEYVIAYAKSDSFRFNALRSEKKNYSEKGVWNVFWSGADRPTMRYELLGFAPQTGQWRWAKEKAIEAAENYEKYKREYADKMTLEEYWKHTGETLKFLRRIENGAGKNGGVQYWIAPQATSLRTSNWTDIEVSEIAKEFDLKFSNPKNRNLIQTLLDAVDDSDAIVLDIFCGSGTTAHAVMEKNVEDAGNRRYLCVQIPEVTPEKSEARMDGYNTISEIALERIKRAAQKIKEEHTDFEGDLGVKVYKQTSSHFPVWQPKSFDSDEMLQMSIGNFVEQKPVGDNKARAVELLLKLGYDLNTSVEEKDGYFLAAEGKVALVVDTASSVDLDAVIAQEPSTVVVIEDVFKTNDAKINFALACKEKNITLQTV